MGVDDRAPRHAVLCRNAAHRSAGLYDDLLGFAELREVWAECSALAEACLIYTQQHLAQAEGLTVIALGKFGGEELGYGADQIAALRTEKVI